MLVRDTHIAHGNIVVGDHTFQLVILTDDRKRHDALCLHQLPRFLQCDALRHTGSPSEIDILNLCAHVCDKLGCFHTKIIQYVSGLPIHRTGSLCLIMFFFGLIL